MSFTLSREPLELRFRSAAVRHIVEVTPGYRRVVLGGEELAGFVSPGADDHIRVFFPRAGAPVDAATARELPSREYTPVAWNGVDELTLDFVLHGRDADGQVHGGVAAAWAAAAVVGDPVFVGGPRGSLVVHGAPDWWLLAGDLTALPAIRRFAAQAAPGAPVDVVLTADDPADVQELDSPGDVRVRWVHPDAGAAPGDTTRLAEALARSPRRTGDGFAFVAAEQSVVKAARSALLERGVDLSRAVVKGYWKRGEAEYHAPHGTAAETAA